MRSSRLSIRMLVFVLILFAAGSAQGRTWRVEADGSGHCTTIQAAVDSASSGDRIMIGPGRYDQVALRSTPSGYAARAIALWEDDKDLEFISRDHAMVEIGPEEGLSGELDFGFCSNGNGLIRIEGLHFMNLEYGVMNRGGVEAYACTFRNGEVAIASRFGGPCRAEGCEFEDYSRAIDYSTSDAVYIEGSRFRNARITVSGRVPASVRNCTLHSSSISLFGIQEGLVEQCEATGEFYLHMSNCQEMLIRENSLDLTDGVAFSIYSGRTTITNNRVRGGYYTLEAYGGTDTFIEFHENDVFSPEEAVFAMRGFTTLHASQNNIIREIWYECRWFIHCDGYDRSSTARIQVGNNYWGPIDSIEALLQTRTWDGYDDGELKIYAEHDPIMTEPFRAEPLPTRKESLGGVRAMFR